MRESFVRVRGPVPPNIAARISALHAAAILDGIKDGMVAAGRQELLAQFRRGDNLTDTELLLAIQAEADEINGTRHRCS